MKHLETKREIIASNIKYFRKIIGVKQKEIAPRADMDKTQWSHYESGKSTPNAENLTKIADALNVSTDSLLKSENKSKENPQALDEIANKIEIESQNLPINKTKIIKDTLEIIRSGNEEMIKSFNITVQAFLGAIKTRKEN